MNKIYGFQTEEDARKYARRNLYRNSYDIYETNQGTYAIQMRGEER